MVGMFRFHGMAGLARPPAADLDWSSATGADPRILEFQMVRGSWNPLGCWGLWITLDDQMDDQMDDSYDIHPLGWIWSVWKESFRLATHRLAKGNQPLSLKKSAHPPEKQISRTVHPQSTIIPKWLCFMASHCPWNSSCFRSSWVSARPHSRRIGFKWQPWERKITRSELWQDDLRHGTPLKR